MIALTTPPSFSRLALLRVVAIGSDGSLLVADDVGDVIWRVTGAQPG